VSVLIELTKAQESTEESGMQHILCWMLTGDGGSVLSAQW